MNKGSYRMLLRNLRKKEEEKNVSMNKEELEEARYFIIECSTKGMTRAETLLSFLESKREEIERKAYESGQKNGIESLIKIEKRLQSGKKYFEEEEKQYKPITYDQWKEQKQEQ